jgi:hypothetical protein
MAKRRRKPARKKTSPDPAAESLASKLLDQMAKVLSEVGAIGPRMAAIERGQSDADSSRRRIHEKLDEQASDIAVMKITTARTAILVDKHEEAYQQKIGERRLVARVLKILKAHPVIWSVIAAVLAALGVHVATAPPHP